MLDHKVIGNDRKTAWTTGRDAYYTVEKSRPQGGWLAVTTVKWGQGRQKEEATSEHWLWWSRAWREVPSLAVTTLC